MSYIINKSDGTVLTTLEDGVLNTTTSIGLIGRNYTGYGEIQNENFLVLLENFANANPPARPIKGQAWFDSVNLLFNVYDGEKWIPVGAAQSSAVEPAGIPGAFWHKTTTDQVFVYTGIEGWKLVGPETVDGFDKTKSESRIVKDVDGNDHAVIVNIVDGRIISILSNDQFTIESSGEYQGFFSISRGVNINNTPNPLYAISGRLNGNAATATKFETARSINGFVYDGTNDITITANTAGSLIKGDYITGNNFNGSLTTTWSVDATPDNVIGKVVARDSAGDFSAGKITADEFIGIHKGNVDVNSGISTFDRIVCNSLEGAEFGGNAFSATKLQPGRTINGVLFNGTQNITIATDASTLTGTTLATGVLNSSLQSLGVLNSLSTTNLGITVGSTNQIKISIESNAPTIKDLNGQGLNISLNDTAQPSNTATFRFITSAQALLLGGPSAPTLVAPVGGVYNLGLPSFKFNNVYGNTFQGVSATAQYADLAENYLADAAYSPGTVVMFGGNAEVTLADENTSAVAGVVSKNPAYLMNSELSGDSVISLALQGRVPCAVIGSVRKGDLLVSAGGGAAKSSRSPRIGSVIGKSLEDFDGESGVIEVVVGRL